MGFLKVLLVRELGQNNMDLLLQVMGANMKMSDLSSVYLLL
jgi:hypothetical protein